MGYCRKVSIKRHELKTYADLANHLWTTFTFLPKNHSRIDIVFDLYLDASIKEEEHLRRSKDKAIEVNTSSYHQVSYFYRGGSRKMSPPYLWSRFNILACFRDVFIGLMLKYAYLLLVITSSLSSIFS